MKSVQNIAAAIFIIAVIVLTAISIFGVWDLLGDDVIMKSFQTLGLLAFVAVIAMVAGRFIERRSESNKEGVIDIPNPIFKTVRRITLSVLIVAASLLALLGVLAIWDVINDEQVLFKSFSSLAISAFGALIVVMTCLERENKFSGNKTRLSVGAIVGIIILIYLVLSFTGMLAGMWWN